jgi:hypothetical protein
LPDPEPALLKRISKPSARKLAAIDKQSVLLVNISTFLSELDAGDGDTKQHLAYTLDNLSKLPNAAYDNSIPAPRDFKIYWKAMDGPDVEQWTASIKEKLASLKKCKVYKLVPRSAVPSDCKVLYGQWVFRRKVNSSGNTTWYKSHYIFGGNCQVSGWDYDRTSAPTAHAKAFYLLLSYTRMHDWDTQQFDIKTTYLNGILGPEDVQYMEQPPSTTMINFVDIGVPIAYGFLFLFVAGLLGCWICTLYLNHAIRYISNCRKTVSLLRHYIPIFSLYIFSSLCFPNSNFHIVSPISRLQAALVEIPTIPPTTLISRSFLIAVWPCSPWGSPKLSAKKESKYDGRIIKEERDNDFGDDVLPYEDKSFILAARLLILEAGSA